MAVVRSEKQKGRRRGLLYAAGLIVLAVLLTYLVDLFPDKQKELRGGIRRAAEEAFPEDAAAVAASYGLMLLGEDLDTGLALDALSVVLIHGLDDPGKVWRSLTPVLQDQGLNVWRFRYPNDQSIVESSGFLLQELENLSEQGVEEVALVAHSMGGLVARETLTSPELGYGAAATRGETPRVVGLVLVATPNHGAELARFGVFGELRDQWVRVLEGRAELLGGILDGVGEARLDLLPGSPFLTTLNARPHPLGVRMLIIAGDICPWSQEELVEMGSEASLGKVESALMRILCETVGDGLVPVSSTRLDGIPHEIVHGTHLSVIRNVMEGSTRLPPAIPLVLDFLHEIQGQDQRLQAESPD
jgi:pimeloyl-ACP methyl ester carboxylesterase